MAGCADSNGSAMPSSGSAMPDTTSIHANINGNGTAAVTAVATAARSIGKKEEITNFFSEEILKKKTSTQTSLEI